MTEDAFYLATQTNTGFEIMHSLLLPPPPPEPTPQRCPTPIRQLKTLYIHRLVLISQLTRNCRVICAKSTKLFKTCFQKQFFIL